MHDAHSLPAVNVDLMRSLFVIAEVGSLNQAAERLRVSQSTLTRQMQSLEHNIGGRLLERGPTGVALTAAGHALLDGMRPLLASFDAVIADTRRRARGQNVELRIGYIASAASEFLNPALAALRAKHPEIRIRLVDLSPGEQLAALRRGELDLALIGHAGTFVSREFHLRRIALFPVCVALPANHPRAREESIRLEDLRHELFVGAVESDLPGHNRWSTALCRKAGFRPRFVADAESLSHALSTVITEGAVAFLPLYSAKVGAPGVIFRPLRDSTARWELLVAWQRGRVPDAVQVLLEALPKKPHL